MARWSYDLCGAEPIIRDMHAEADTYVAGEWAAEGKADTNTRGLIVSGEAMLLAGFVGIFNEAITTTTDIDTATTFTSANLARIIINPFAVYRAPYDLAVLITAAGAGPTFTCGSGLGDASMGGSWLYRAGDPGAGELDLVEDSSVSTTTCTVVTSNTATAAFTSASTFIIIQGVGSRVMYLGDAELSTHIDSGQDNIGTGGAPAWVISNYIQTTGVPTTPLNASWVGKIDLDVSGVNVVFSSDVCFARGNSMIKELTLT